jgi:FkbM family methyltransferase
MWFLVITITILIGCIVGIIYLGMKWNPGKKSYSQYGQDLKALKHVNHKRNGYYIEIGVHDGKSNSNTYLMDTQYGWKGVCIDPFMANMGERSCTQYYTALGSTPGKASFSGAGNGIGGLTEFSTSDTHNKRHTQQTRTFDTQTVQVATPQDVFKDANVPSTIDFMSLDVEGAEMDVLKAFPFQKYCVRFAAIETNNDESKEHEMREFMKKQGYAFAGHEHVDDYYTKECN